MAYRAANLGARVEPTQKSVAAEGCDQAVATRVLGTPEGVQFPDIFLQKREEFRVRERPQLLIGEGAAYTISDRSHPLVYVSHPLGSSRNDQSG